SFVPDAGGGPPSGSVGAIMLRDASNASVATFGTLSTLHVTVAQLIADPTLLVAGADDFRGSSGDDTLHAGAGNDVLDGAAGNDHLFGQTGDDVIAGDTGND